MFVRAEENFPTDFVLSLNTVSFYLCVMGATRLSTENFQLLLVRLTVNECGLLGLQQQIQKGPLLKSFQSGSLMVSFTACFKVTSVPTFAAAEE